MSKPEGGRGAARWNSDSAGSANTSSGTPRAAGPAHPDRLRAAATDGAAAQVNIFRGLLWREWLAHGRLFWGALAAWLVLGWVLMIFIHPGFIIAFGAVVALLAGPNIGGAEVTEGSEEFSLSLPPTRSQRYLVRLLLGAGMMLLFTVFGVLTIRFDLPQRIWGLFVESGFTEPFPPVERGISYPLAVAIPLAVFAVTFTVAALAHSRELAARSWFIGAAGVGFLTVICLLAEYWILWSEVSGRLACPVLFALSPVVLVAGYAAYVRKEGVGRPPSVAPSHWWKVVVVTAVVLLILIITWFNWQVSEVSRSRSLDEIEPAVPIEVIEPGQAPGVRDGESPPEVGQEGDSADDKAEPSAPERAPDGKE